MSEENTQQVIWEQKNTMTMNFVSRASLTCVLRKTLSSEAETLKIRIRLSSIIIGMQCPMTTRDLHVRNMRSICDVIIIHDDKSNEIVCLTCEFCRFVEVAYIEKGEGAAVIVSTEKK